MRVWICYFAVVVLLLLPSQIFAQDNVPRFEEADCVEAVPEAALSSVRCGYLIVLESRASDADPARTIRLPLAIIASTSENPAPDPLIYPTNGGPGISTLISLGNWATWDWMLPYRDVILVEQRGTEYAQPNLNCPEIDTADLVNYSLLLSREEEIALVAESAGTCRERLLDEDINLAAYNSAESAADLADLRQVLGYDQWNLFGVSYGGRLAMTVMRDQPEGLRSVILDSVYTSNLNRYEEIPPSFSQAIDRLFAACAADAECNAAYPELEPNFYRVVDDWNANPRPVVIQNPFTDEPFELHLNGDDLVNGIFDALYDPVLITALPFVLDQLAQGNDDPVFPLAQDALGNPDNISALGMTYSVECQEEMPFNDPDKIQAAYAAHPVLAHFTSFLAYPAVCDVWDVPPSDPIETEPVTSDIPTLVLAGQFDPIHPNFWGQAAAETMPNSYFYEFPAMGHAQVFWDDCPAKMAEDFINDPSTAPDTSCIESMPAPNFLTPDKIYITPAVFRLNIDLIEGRNPVIGQLLGYCALLFAAQVISLPVLWFRGRRPGAAAVSTTSQPPRWVNILASVVALLNLIFMIVMAVVFLFSDFLILAFGLPAEVSLLLVIPIITGVLTIGLIGALVLVWARRYWTPPRRVFFSLVVIASVAFSVWLLTSDLLPIRL